MAREYIKPWVKPFIVVLTFLILCFSQGVGDLLIESLSSRFESFDHTEGMDICFYSWAWCRASLTIWVSFQFTKFYVSHILPHIHMGRVIYKGLVGCCYSESPSAPQSGVAGIDLKKSGERPSYSPFRLATLGSSAKVGPLPKGAFSKVGRLQAVNSLLTTLW